MTPRVPSVVDAAVPLIEMDSPRVVTGALGGSKLSREAQSGRLAHWYESAPTGSAAWSSYGRAVMASVPISWLSDLREAIRPSGVAHDRLERSAHGKGLVITTGQQPGMFGGPLMSLIKAISARALADELEQMTGIPVAPVFWAATDDADFDEAAVVSVALDGGPRELRMEQHAAPGTPMARVPLGDEVGSLAAVLRDACGSAPHASYLARALGAYASGTTVGDAYVALLRAVLEPLGIAVLDASHAAVARAASPILSRAVTMRDAVAAAVRERNAEIIAAGFALQVEEVPGLSLVFLNNDGVKRRVSLADAASMGALTDRQFLSSTVLLRPVVERSILPTAAYVGGPGEIAYFAQIGAVAAALDAPRPLVVPRWSATIVEPRVQRILDGLGISADELSMPDAVERRVARNAMPPATERALSDLRATVDAGVGGLALANDAIVPEQVLDGLRSALEHRLQRVERRFVAGIKRRETELMRSVATARGSLYPYGTRQERKLAYIPFLARYGPDLLRDMLDAARAHARALVTGSPASTTAGG